MSALPQTPPPRVTRVTGAATRTTARSAPGPGRPRPQLRVVTPRPNRRWVALMIGLVLAGVLAVVALQAQAAGAAFEVRELQREVTELEYRHEALTAEVARLGAPERMRRIATEDLGMVPAEGATYVRLGDGSQPAVNGSVDPVKQVRAGQ